MQPGITEPFFYDWHARIHGEDRRIQGELSDSATRSVPEPSAGSSPAPEPGQPREGPTPPGGPSSAPKRLGYSPATSSTSTPSAYGASTCCSSWRLPPAGSASSASPPTRSAPGPLRSSPGPSTGHVRHVFVAVPNFPSGRVVVVRLDGSVPRPFTGPSDRVGSHHHRPLTWMMAPTRKSEASQ